jgi:transposase InsO family protein
MGLSRQAAHRWVDRFDQEGFDGLHDRSSRPHSVANRTPGQRRGRGAGRPGRTPCRAGSGRRRDRGPGPDGLAILARHARPPVSALDPTTGQAIRAWQATAVRYERPAPGDLVHLDVKKLGRIPEGYGWRSHGRAGYSPLRDHKTRVGFDYVHAAVDDHSRLAYAEILGDEKGATVAAFLTRAAAFFASHGITIREVITDNAFAYRNWAHLRDAVAALGAKQRFIKPQCPRQKERVERFNRTLQAEWAYRQPFTSNQARTDALAPWLEHYNTERKHDGIAGKPPISRCPS